MTMSGDRLSRLPDAMLWQVLSYVPAKEAVCSGALARSWRSHWLSSGSINLDSRSYGAGRLRPSPSLDFIRDANATLRAMAAAMDGEGSVLRRLTFTYLAPDNEENTYFSRRDIDGGIDALLFGSPATRGLEELRVDVSPTCCCTLDITAVPSDALRELHLAGLRLARPQHGSDEPASFARLETLQLRRCYVRLTDLQAMVDAAPVLAALELDRVRLSYRPAPGSSGGKERIRCPSVTRLSLANLGGGWCGRGASLELDAPSLRRFAYRGHLLPLSLVSPPPASMARADLHFELDFFPAGASGDRRKDEVCQFFWRFVGGFGGADILKVSFEQPGGRRRAEQIKASIEEGRRRAEQIRTRDSTEGGRRRAIRLEQKEYV